MMSAQDRQKVRLSSSVTVARYSAMESSRDREGLADFIEERLLERYVLPVTQTCHKNGFIMIAASWLLIETLESFYRGWEDTSKRMKRDDIDPNCRPIDTKSDRISRSQVAFCYFFGRFTKFSDLHPLAGSIYTCVRCGILHQGETKGGWRVLRKGPMFEPASLTLNATKFLNQVADCVTRYANCLRGAEWESDRWRNFIGKMAAIIRHCDPA
jgi:hypothetical protein